MKQYRSPTNNFNGMVSVSIPYRFRIILLSTSYQPPITKRKTYGKRTKEVRRSKNGQTVKKLFTF